MLKKLHRWCLTTPHLPRSLVAFAVSLAALTLLDSGAQVVVAHLKRTAPTLFAWSVAGTFDTSFAPEVWLSVIGLTLGTLIIVISIAAQNIPKITELYMQDWISLIYVWSLVLGGAHIFYIKVLQDLGRQPVGSILLNLYGLLPLAILTALPYIFYILQSIQPESVVQQIYRHQSRYMSQLAVIFRDRFSYQPQFLRRSQAYLIAGLNQLDDLLAYVAFRGTQAEIISAVSELLQDYISCKPNYPDYFFRLSGAVKGDIAFKTMFDQFSQIEENHTFYEQKCFRLLGNAYVRFLEEGQFPLASLCGSQMCAIAQHILSRGDDILLDLIIIRFNTMMRFAIKHGNRHNEARNLYNLAFHYRRFIESLVHYQRPHLTQKCVNHLRAYGNEVYELAQSSPALYFIVDVFAAELKKVLILVNEQRWEERLQLELLEEMLRLDNPPELRPPQNSDRPYGKSTGVRLLQMGLALFYLARQQPQFAQRIVEDMVEDAVVLGLSEFKRLFHQNCDRLRQAEPRFWEDTDRGNANLYYSEHTEQLGALQTLVDRACHTLELAESS
ncbi:hypothetical protein NK55_03575 [Thermosynechococcus sp. NK55a]|uniref:hypothetical protein n=1 Tax=Thermosynechococcus sp. NK55a TaxID=1394889 RepID=UPI0003D90A95|nr:hypothetical protein [Thermosynechococcus sp. NK55a]AHB88057.1 hypothetical protein NK55_03575 [Thermosynechococcus sp. NK55a]